MNVSLTIPRVTVVQGEMTNSRVGNAITIVGMKSLNWVLKDK